MEPELPKENPTCFISKACSHPRYTSRVEIRQIEWFTCSPVLLKITVAFTIFLVAVNVSSLEVSFRVLIVSLSGLGSPIGVIANEHSII